LARILLYSPANLNLMDGSAIWVQAIAEVLHAGAENHITIPLREPELRDMTTRLIRSLPRVRLVPTTQSHTLATAVGLIEALDREERFDVFLIRSFGACRIAARRERLRDRLWSTYIVEPERDSWETEHNAQLSAIAINSHHLVAQSEEMRELTEQAIPAARGRILLLPPAIPDHPAKRVDPQKPVARLVYSGKFNPFYPVGRLIEGFVRLRREIPGLEFLVLGDKIYNDPTDPGYAPGLRHLLGSTRGLVWRGAVSRDENEALLAEGGIGLNVWDYRYGSRTNDLVVSTKLLDYGSVGLPTILNRNRSQERILGRGYPLFVDTVEEVEDLMRRVLRDPILYRDCADWIYEAVRPFGYSAVYSGIAPFIDRARTDASRGFPIERMRAMARWLTGPRSRLG
jgi:glycosyltransferase involved in cell wall biosynthesis